MRTPGGRLATCAALLAAAIALGACAEQGAEAAGDGMGEGGGGMVVGVVATPGSAQLAPAASASESDSVSVAMVLTPADGWLVARSTSEGRAVLGATPVRAGESRGVRIVLEAADEPFVDVALHVDLGVRGRFEFDPARPERSADRPVLVDRRPVEQRVEVPAFGAFSPAHSASIMAADQPGATGSIHIDYALVPKRSWASVRLMEDGLPGAVVGTLPVSPIEAFEIDVPVTGPLTDEVIVTLHVDDGQADVFEYDASDWSRTSDRPYVSVQRTVSKVVRVR